METGSAAQSSFCAPRLGFCRKLVRRKHVDSSRWQKRGGQQLARNLSVLQLIPIGVGSTIGAGVYVLIGTVARERSGPALTISFLIAGIAAALSAFCYAELSSRCPSAGSAYHYSYICIGEGIAWLIGWALVLEYTVSGSAVARGISPNLALLFGGEEKLPVWIVQRHIPGTELVVDPCAALLVILVTVLLCAGVKESAIVQMVITSANVFALLFVIFAGTVIGFETSWFGYKQSQGFLPFGVNGMLSGAATVFFAYIGFDTVASTAEEVKHPQRDLPLGIGGSLLICGSLYMLVSAVIVGIIPYYEMDINTPIATAFAKYGIAWIMYIVAIGGVAALSSTLLGSLLPQPRILMAMARDGLLPSFFLKISNLTAVPINGTLVTGVLASLMAFALDVDQLSGMVSVGTLLAFMVVGVSLLILRYVPPIDVPIIVADDAPLTAHLLPSLVQTCPEEKLAATLPEIIAKEQFLSLSVPSDSYLPMNSGIEDSYGSLSNKSAISEDKELSGQEVNSNEIPRVNLQISLLTKMTCYNGKPKEENRRWASIMSILAVCIGAVVIALSTSIELLPSWLRWSLGLVGVLVFGSACIVLSILEQDEGQHTFGQSGGFICPFVPWLPVASILINVYLLANLGSSTWLRVSIWFVIGGAIYFVYGVGHSSTAERADLKVPSESQYVC
eukprot:c27493_g1_i1 orf=508-2535(-)